MTLDEVAKLCQNCVQRNPVLVLGSGASVPLGIRGMGELAVWLKDKIETDEDSEADAWLLVRTALANKDHLEAALEKHTLPDSLVKKVVRSTWDFIAADDYSLLKSAINTGSEFPLRVLLSGLFRSTNKNIQVITTNYDRAIEYAADSGGYITSTGFLPGYLRHSNGADQLGFWQGASRARTVTIWKVHGSLDWFVNSNGDVISLPLTNELPEGLTPLIVTPGVSKYQRTHDEPFRSAIQGADQALRNASSIVCLGYGFRDSHIHPKLVTRCKEHDVPILVAARTLTAEAHEFLKYSAGRHFIALENHEDGTVAYTRDTPDGFLIAGGKYWEASALNNLIGF